MVTKRKYSKKTKETDMAVDSYMETLSQMVQLFKEYKPGSVTLENITRLCQTMGLESFVDDISNDLARLSTASKIIVIDIDFDKINNKVKDVKLVLASNFDYFNYFIDDYDQSKGESNNVLLNSLILYNDLKQFHNNLQFLNLLDTYSQVDIDNSTSAGPTMGNTFNGAYHSSNTNNHAGSIGFSFDNSNTTTNPTNNGNSNNNILSTGTMNDSNTLTNQNATNKNGKLDLFKYFTELREHTTKYVQTYNKNLNVVANLGNNIGVYIIKPNSDQTTTDKKYLENGSNILAKITIQKSKNPQHQLFEYIYSDATKNWMNESPNHNICGASLILEIYNEDIYFPESFVTDDMIYDNSPENTKEKNTYMSQLFNNVIINTNNTTDGISNEKEIVLLNNFTTKLINVKKIDISNENLDLLSDILKWIEWYNEVLIPLFNMLETTIKGTRNINEQNNSFNSHHLHRFHNHNKKRLSNIIVGPNNLPHTSIRHRRSSSKNKKPNLTESTILKEEGLQQFSLHDILSQPVVEETELTLSVSPNNEEALIVDDDESDKMVIDDNGMMSSNNTSTDQSTLQFILSEDNMEFNNQLKCSLYDDRNNWNIFLRDIKNFIE